MSEDKMFSEMSLSEFAAILGSSAPAPGGGGAAALDGAQGAALAAMVCALTIGKKKYADAQQLAEDSKKKLDDLRERFIAAIDRDRVAFGPIAAAYGMPKETDAEKAARAEAMQAALKGGTKVPFDTLEMCLETIELVKPLVGRTNVSAMSDLGVSAACLTSAARSAWLNVLINIGGIEDKAFADDHRARGQAILGKLLPLAEEIYKEVERAL